VPTPASIITSTRHHRTANPTNWLGATCTDHPQTTPVGHVWRATVSVYPTTGAQRTQRRNTRGPAELVFQICNFRCTKHRVLVETIGRLAHDHHRNPTATSRRDATVGRIQRRRHLFSGARRSSRRALASTGNLPALGQDRRNTPPAPSFIICWGAPAPEGEKKKKKCFRGTPGHRLQRRRTGGGSHERVTRRPAVELYDGQITTGLPSDFDALAEDYLQNTADRRRRSYRSALVWAIGRAHASGLACQTMWWPRTTGRIDQPVDGNSNCQPSIRGTSPRPTSCESRQRRRRALGIPSTTYAVPGGRPAPQPLTLGAITHQ